MDIFERVEQRVVELHVPIRRAIRDFGLDNQCFIFIELEVGRPISLFDQGPRHADRLEHVIADALHHPVLHLEILLGLARGELGHFLDALEDFLRAQSLLGRHLVEAFDRKHRDHFLGPIIEPVAGVHGAGLRVDRGPVAIVTCRTFRTENDLEVRTQFDADIVGIEFVVRVGHGRIVIGARKRGLRREAQDLAGAAIAGDPVGQVSADRRLDIDIVGIGLQCEHRIPQRRPVGVFGVGVEIHEIRIAQAGHRLAIDVRAIFTIVRVPGVLQVRHCAFEIGEIGQDRRRDLGGHVCLPRPWWPV